MTVFEWSNWDWNTGLFGVRIGSGMNWSGLDWVFILSLALPYTPVPGLCCFLFGSASALEVPL